MATLTDKLQDDETVIIHSFKFNNQILNLSVVGENPYDSYVINHTHTYCPKDERKVCLLSPNTNLQKRPLDIPIPGWYRKLDSECDEIFYEGELTIDFKRTKIVNANQIVINMIITDRFDEWATDLMACYGGPSREGKYTIVRKKRLTVTKKDNKISYRLEDLL